MEKANLIPESVAGGEIGPGKDGAKLETDGIRVEKDGPAVETVPRSGGVSGGGVLAPKIVVHETITCNTLRTTECLTISISVCCVRRIVLNILHHLLDRYVLV